MRSAAKTKARASAHEAYGPDNPDPRPGFYYVSAIDGARRSLVRGPFPTHAAALEAVEPAKKLVEERDPRAHWYAWGTARNEVNLGPGALDRWEATRAGGSSEPAKRSRSASAAKVKRERGSEAARELASLRDVADMRAQAIMQATEALLEAALRRPAWRDFEGEWLVRRVHEARVSLGQAPAAVRLPFMESLRPTARTLRDEAAGRFETAIAAAHALEALTRLFDALEGREARALTTSEEVYAAAERMRQAGGFPYFNRTSRTVDRLPKAKAIGGSVWVVNQQPGDNGRSYVLTHGPSGTVVSLPSIPKAKIEAVARLMAQELPDFERDAPLIHEIEGGSLGTQLVGGVPVERHRELYAVRDRAMERLGITWGGAT